MPYMVIYWYTTPADGTKFFGATGQNDITPLTNIKNVSDVSTLPTLLCIRQTADGRHGIAVLGSQSQYQAPANQFNTNLLYEDFDTTSAVESSAPQVASHLNNGDWVLLELTSEPNPYRLFYKRIKDDAWQSRFRAGQHHLFQAKQTIQEMLDMLKRPA